MAKKTLESKIRRKDPYELAAEKIFEMCCEFNYKDNTKEYVGYEKLTDLKKLFVDRISEYFKSKFKENVSKVATYLVNSPSVLPLEQIMTGLD